MNIDFLTQNLFENAYFVSHTLLAIDTKQISGDPVHTVYVPIDVKDDESGEVFSSSVTISRNNPTQTWVVKCNQIKNTDELAKAWKCRIEKPEITKESIPLGMQINFEGELFVVSSHSNGSDGELRAGLANSKGQVMGLNVELLLQEIESGLCEVLGYLDPSELKDKDFFAWRKSFFETLKK